MTSSKSEVNKIKLEAGKWYVTENEEYFQCIYTEKNRAWMIQMGGARVGDIGPAFQWNTDGSFVTYDKYRGEPSRIHSECFLDTATRTLTYPKTKVNATTASHDTKLEKHAAITDDVLEEYATLIDSGVSHTQAAKKVGHARSTMQRHYANRKGL